MEIVDKIVYKKLSEIKPYIRNARHNEKTVQLLTKIIPKVGFNVPIVIDKKGVIVKGHARYIAAVRLGINKVPCVVSHASEDDIKLDRIADNMVSEYSLWVTDALLDELRDLDIDFDMSELELPSFNNALADDDSNMVVSTSASEVVASANNQAGGRLKPAKYYKIVCPDCGEVSFIKLEDTL